MKNYVFLIGGVGNILFQVSYALTLTRNPAENVILVDSKPRGRFLRSIYPLTLHSDWLGVEQISRSLNLEVCPPNFLQWCLLAGLYGLRKLFRRDSGFTMFGARYHIGYFQHIDYPKDIITQVTSAVSSQLSDVKEDVDNSENNYLLVHARGFDFSKGSRLNISQIIRVASRFEGVVVVGNDKELETEISRNLAVRNRSSSPKCDFVTIGSAKHLLCADSTFAFWATVAISPKDTAIFTKRHSVFFTYRSLFGSVEAIDE